MMAFNIVGKILSSSDLLIKKKINLVGIKRQNFCIVDKVTTSSTKGERIATCINNGVSHQERKNKFKKFCWWGLHSFCAMDITPRI